MGRKNIHFPTVWRQASKGHHRTVAIVFKKRVEYYGEGGDGDAPVRTYRDNKEDKTFDPFHEEEMLRDEGYRRVHEGKY